MHQSDLLILGGGLAGLSLACALKGHSINVDLFERNEPEPCLSLHRDCRVVAIVAGTVEILQGLGIWERVAGRAGPIRSMHVWDGQNAGGIRFEAGEVGLDALGYIIENSVLREAMIETLADAENINLHCPVEATSCRWDTAAVQLQLTDGSRYQAPLIVAADGGRSWLREQAGIGVRSRDFYQRGIVATVRPRLPHHGRAFQRFQSSGPLAMLPLDDGLCSLVWSASNGKASDLMKMDDKAFLSELNLAFGPQLGRLQEVGMRAAFPLRAQLARQQTLSRVALIGDAAHTIHPLAGLGANLGFRDAMVMAQEIVDARYFDEDIGSASVLNRYARARLPDTLSVMAAMEAFHQIFSHDFRPLSLLRGAGMLAVGNSGPLKHLLMRSGMGLAQPVPRQIT